MASVPSSRVLAHLEEAVHGMSIVMLASYPSLIMLYVVDKLVVPRSVLPWTI